MTAPVRDRRYGTQRWRRVRRQVLIRDAGICRIVPGCVEPATVADHIIPSFPGMTDRLFFGLTNLRAGCKHHNTARGVAARLEREAGPVDQPTTVVTRDYTRRAGNGAA